MPLRVCVILLLLICPACSSPDSTPADNSPRTNPKSFYGQTVKKARDVQTPSAEEQSEQEQADEVMNDE